MSIGIADLRRPIENWPTPDAVIHLAGGYAGASQRELAETDLAIAAKSARWASGSESATGFSPVRRRSTVPLPGEADEHRRCHPVIPYGPRRLTMERMFQAAGFPALTICRLGEVYGRGGRILQEIPDRLRRGFCPWPGDGEVRNQLSARGGRGRRPDFAPVTRLEPGCEIYNVGDREPATWRQFLDCLAAALGTRRATYCRTVSPAAMPGSSVGKAPSEAPGAVTPWVMRLLTTPKVLSSERIRQRLGFTPDTPAWKVGSRGFTWAISKAKGWRRARRPRRRLLLDAAIALFGRLGYHTATSR